MKTQKKTMETLKNASKTRKQGYEQMKATAPSSINKMKCGFWECIYYILLGKISCCNFYKQKIDFLYFIRRCNRFTRRMRIFI